MRWHAKACQHPHPTTNWFNYNPFLKRRGSLSAWFDPALPWKAERNGKRGHPETFSDSAVQTCLTLKVQFGLLLLQSEPLMRDWFEHNGERSYRKSDRDGRAWLDRI